MGRWRRGKRGLGHSRPCSSMKDRLRDLAPTVPRLQEEDASERRLRGDLPLLHSRHHVLSLRRLSRLLRRESLLLSLRRRLRPLSIPGMNIHGNIFLAFRLLIWQPSLLFLFLLFLLFFFFWGGFPPLLSRVWVRATLSCSVCSSSCDQQHSLTTKDC